MERGGDREEAKEETLSATCEKKVESAFFCPFPRDRIMVGRRQVMVLATFWQVFVSSVTNLQLIFLEFAFLEKFLS